MASFFTVPAFTTLGITDPRFVVGAVAVQAFLFGTYVGAPDATPGPDQSTPYPGNVPFLSGADPIVTSAGASAASQKAGLQSRVSQAQAVVTTDQTNLTNAQASLSSLLSSYQGAQQATTAAQGTIRAAQDAYDAARMERFRAQINLGTMTRRNDADGVSAAKTRIATDDLAVAAALVAYQQAQTALDPSLLATAKTAYFLQQIVVAQLNQTLLLDQLKLDVAQTNLGNNPGAVYSVDVAAASTGIASTLSTAGAIPQYTTDDGGNQYVSSYKVEYSQQFTSGKYQLVVTLPDDVHKAALAQGTSFLLTWYEVTVTSARKEVTVPTPDPDALHPHPPYTYDTVDSDGAAAITIGGVQTATLAASAAVDDGLGGWLLTTGTFAVASPTPPDGTTSTVYVVGGPEAPVTGLVSQHQDAALERQGFLEFTTEGDSPVVRRYLTSTASAAPGAPADAKYSGSQVWTVPTDGTVADGSGSPTPLHLVDTMSTAASAGSLLPTQPVAVDHDASLVSPTRRVMTNPAGLQFDLSGEQTPGTIQATVQATVAAAWPDNDADQSNDGAGTFSTRFFSKDGNTAQARRTRYKLRCSLPDNRLVGSGNTFTVTAKWLERTTNLDTGAVSDAPHQRSVSFIGGQTTVTDAAWTELPVPGANQRVEIIPLPGANDGTPVFAPIVGTLAPPTGGG